MAVGVVKARVVVLAPLVAVIVEVAEPCRVKAWEVDPIVRAPVGVMVLVDTVPIVPVPVIVALLLTVSAVPEAEKVVAPLKVLAEVPVWV